MNIKYYRLYFGTGLRRVGVLTLVGTIDYKKCALRYIKGHIIMQSSTTVFFLNSILF